MAIQAGDSLNSVPASLKQTLATNYLDFTAQSTSGWAQQYLPDLMEKEAEVFGPRTISGFLNKVGAEESMTSDQVVWSEQGRLHLSYKASVTDNNGTIASPTNAADGGELTITSDIDGNSDNASNHGIRVNDTIIVAGAAGVRKCIVREVHATDASISVEVYGFAD